MSLAPRNSEGADELISLLLVHGFNAFLPVQKDRIDMIAYRDTDEAVRLVRHKTRWFIEKENIGRDIWIAFPDGSDWYLVPHNRMLRDAEEAGFTASRSWREDGIYHCPRLSQALRGACAQFLLGRPGGGIEANLPAVEGDDP